LSLSFLPFPIHEGQSKSSRNSFTSTVWFTISSYHLDRRLLVICTCKFFWGCAMQFGGSGATSSRQGQWFLHHDNAPSNSSLVVSSPSYRILRTSLQVTSKFPTLKISLKGTRVTFDWMSSMVAKRIPLKVIFRVGNSQTSLGGRSGERGGCWW
jgi:hypothetical protein